MDSGSRLEVDAFTRRVRSDVYRTLMADHVRARLPAFGIGVAFAAVLVFSVFVPSLSQVSIPEMTVETGAGPVIVRGITIGINSTRPVWGTVVMALVSLLGPTMPVLADALYEAKKDAEQRLPFEIRSRLLQRIGNLEDSRQISSATATSAREMVDRLPDWLDEQLVKAVLDTIHQTGKAKSSGP